MPNLEASLAAFGAEVDAAAKAAKDLAGSLRRLAAATASGQMAEIEKQAALAAKRAEEAAGVAARLPGAWDFDAQGYMADGYLDELRAAAAELGISLFEKDGRVYCFPLLLKLDPREAAIRVEKKLERRVRPKVLARQLAALQKRPQRFREEQFLELLYRAYELKAGRDRQDGDTAQGPLVPVADLFDILTLMPGSDYALPEFGRDLLLLDRKPDLRTRGGFSFRFAGSTLGKGRVRRVTVYDEAGSERVYLAMLFTREEG